MSLETGVDTHTQGTVSAQLEGLNANVFFWKAATLQHKACLSCVFFLFRFLVLFFVFLFCHGCGGVFGRALTKRAWMPPNKPEEKNKTSEKARKKRKVQGVPGGAGRALTKRAWISPNKPEGKNNTSEMARKNKKRCRGCGVGWMLLRANGTGP